MIDRPNEQKLKVGEIEVILRDEMIEIKDTLAERWVLLNINEARALCGWLNKVLL